MMNRMKAIVVPRMKKNVNENVNAKISQAISLV